MQLWPAAAVVDSCHMQTLSDAESDTWKKIDSPPPWMHPLLQVLTIPMPPSAWQEPPFLPQKLRWVASLLQKLLHLYSMQHGI